MTEQYTHGHHESVLRSHATRTVENSAAYLIPRLRAGQEVLDVGCGPGTITADLAARVAPGHVLGIDNAPEILDLARETAAARSVTNVSFAVGDVYHLDAADGGFDVVHAHQVLQHLTDPVAALREMRRVCRADGVVAARDSDYAAMTWYPELPPLDRWLVLYHDVTRSNGAEADAGRRLLAWARAAGFSDVQSSASAWCFATAAQRAWWGGTWAERVVESRIAEQAVERGLATPAELHEIAAAFMEWSASDDAWWAVLHGEVLCTP
ncbi:MAG TPA: methyltransferase domain-containing protein [Acidimicrobiia bacterium]|nr:methyltransferase domain-containing protein [Acidimicrobiia bacterium]